MNYICPFCNSLAHDEVLCEKCHNSMDDLGKVVDYLDDYSAYEEIQTLKLVDGVEHSVHRHECLHLFHCSKCRYEKAIIIQETAYI